MGLPHARATRSDMRSVSLAALFWTFVASSCALAQGAHDWAMWFGTLVIIAVAAVLVSFLIALVRWFKR